MSIRAIIEGICLGTKLILENFGAAFTPKRIVVAGGATHSPLWLQIHADTIGAPLELTEVSDAPALGCAILAACGAGRFATIKEGCKAMVRRRAMIEPDSRRTQLYEREIYPRYVAHCTARLIPSATSARVLEPTKSVYLSQVFQAAFWII